VPKLNYSSEKWKVVTWTGDTGTDANVSTWVYGSKGMAGPMRLQKSNNTNPFLSNQTDEFQINVKDVGKIYKIRMAHDDTGIQPHWKLEKVHYAQQRLDLAVSVMAFAILLFIARSLRQFTDQDKEFASQ
ncbi:hypothetical protein scyTo_0025207, partial [Scyliorhinus torazame]|nr:hypothetical protein [Scyliorhinus torazame]